MPQTKNSIEGFPTFYYARHMRPGLAKGGGRDRSEVMKVDLEAIKKMIPSGNGIPVYIDHQDVDIDTMKEEACGYVTESFLESDGWAWFKIMIIDEAAHDKIASGWSVSNAYIPSEKAAGGTMHNCEYDVEILDGKFTHLALVANPRYEEACIMSQDEFKAYREKQRMQMEQLKNSKEPSAMFKFFQNKKQEITNAADLTEDAYIVIEGQKVSMKDLIKNTKEKMKNEKDGDEDDADKETKKEEKEDEKKNKKSVKKNSDDEGDDDEMENSEATFDVDGEEVSLNALKKSYSNAMKKNEKKNEKERRTKGDEEDEGDDADEEDKEKLNKKGEKRNSKDHFDDIRNANEMGVTKIVIETSMDKVKRGQQRYGSAA